MSDKWYYVLAGERKGPIELEEIQGLIRDNKIGSEDYVWKKGFVNWVQLKTVDELKIEESAPIPDVMESVDLLNEIGRDGNCIFIKIGVDRGGQEVEYGPYSLDLILKLFNENRINAKTFAFIRGMDSWKMLADFGDFEEVFNDTPPPIADDDRRHYQRKPFIARMYIENNKHVFVGVCRDISTGGMQVLVDHFPGKIGDKIAINVHPENTDYHFVASGEIVRFLDGGQGFSFRFKSLSNDSLGAIENYLNNA